MVTVKTKILFLIACLLNSVWLLAAQVSGSIIAVLPCLLAFLVLTCFAAVKGMVVPVLLCFLPFAPLMKLQPGTISFFTIAMLAVYAVYIFIYIRRMYAEHIKIFFFGGVLLALTLAVKTVCRLEISNSYIFFFASVLFVPFMIMELNKLYDFYWLTVFFVVGIVLAAISAQFLSVIPTIQRYIDVRDIAGIVRRSGYYGDPNFYAAHITAALGGVLVLLLNTVKKSKLVILAIFAATLIYCGFLSVSKSFFLIMACMILFWIVDLLARRGKMSIKVMVLATVVIGVIFLLSSSVFTDALDMIVERFDNGGSLSDFTSDRSVIWERYLNALWEDPALLFFGKGLTNVIIGANTSHNTLIQCVYQFGIVGSVFFFGWVIVFTRLLLDKKGINIRDYALISVLLIGGIGPWLALDILFFYEVFLIPLYIFTGIRLLNEQREKTINE